MSLIAFFEEPQAGQLAQVGGKGSNLIVLTRAGFAVPPGFVVTAEAYIQFLDQLDWLDAELAKFDYTHPDILHEHCTALRARLERVALPQTVVEAIRSALARFGAAEGTRAAHEAFAVRSSSTFEDLAQAAFAGQHDTYLNIHGPEAILARVRDCFVSLWGDRAVLYRHHQGFTQRDARMAVVVQRQVACEVAGVGFSINPVSGRLDRLVVDANHGLGESVVGGEFAIDHFEMDKATLQIVERSLGHKERMIVATADGVKEAPVAPERVDQPCLTDAQLETIGQVLKRVEEHYGWPQDIEWGWQDGRLYLLQSRPVTTIQPRWTRAEAAERFPNPVTPLTWDLIAAALRPSLVHSLALTGLPALQGDWLHLVDHYVYGDQNFVELLAAHRALHARTPRELVAEVPLVRQRYGWVLDLPVRWARDLDRFLIGLGRLSAVDLDTLGEADLWRHMQELLAVATEYFLPNLAITITGSYLHRVLHALVSMVVGPDQALPTVDGLLAACETKTAVVNRELHELAMLAHKIPLLRRELLERGGRAFWDQQRLPVYPEFAARLRRFLEDHGHREMDMDYYHPTWSEQPWIVLDALGLILRNTETEGPAETARRLRQRHAETEHHFLALVPEELRFFFHELIRMARTYTMLDDLEHYHTTRINPVARRIALALGRRLQARGILEAPEDVFFFHKAELEALLGDLPQARPEVQRRQIAAVKQAYEASRGQTPPWSLGEDSAGQAPASPDALRGLPGSPGRATGPCFRVTDPADFARFPRGAILVARTTNPAWTPLFYAAAGLITESGGPLSHGAVTAREMRLPAVMSVHGAMTILKDGRVVTVDGSRGLVTPAEIAKPV